MSIGWPIYFTDSGTTLIIPADCAHSQTADPSAITTTTEVTVFDSFHATTAEAGVLIAVFIVPDEAAHSQTADASGVIPVISPADATHSQTADAATSAAPSIISPRECFHGTTAEQSASTGNVSGDVDTVLVLPEHRMRLLEALDTVTLVEVDSLMEVV
jgi:hypothetical protein